MGRTLKPQCPTCRKFHTPKENCPTNVYEKIRSEKWLNSKGFSRTKHLFNYWFAHPYIEKTKSIILTEGQGDVLKLEMAGIHNSVGIFGTELTESQINVLDKSSASRVYISTDSDEAGQAAATKIAKALSEKFEVVRMEPSLKDFGDMTVQEIKNYFNTLKGI